MTFKKHLGPILAVGTLLAPSFASADFYSELGLIYSPYGEVEQLTYPDGSVAVHTYVAGGGGDETSLNSQPAVVDTLYHPAGGVRELRYGDGATATLVPDALGRTLEHRLERSGDGSQPTYRAAGFTYNAWGFVAGFQRADRLLSAPVSYGYDPQGQLTTFALGSAVTSYHYDLRGNLENRQVSGSMPGGLQLGSFTMNGGYDGANQPNDPAWQYDSAGRLTADDQYHYRYNDAGRLVLMLERDTGDVVTHYLYDDAGRRVRVLEDGRVTFFHRDGAGNVLYEETRTLDGELLERRTYALHNGKAVMTEIENEAGQIEHEHRFTDRLGNPVARWTGAGTAVLQEYAPFGQQMHVASQAQHTGSHGFTGHEDDVTERTYMRARYYDAVVARFNRPDPARDFDPHQPASFNLYQYSRNNPVSRIDPTGLSAQEEKTKEEFEDEARGMTLEEVKEALEEGIDQANEAVEIVGKTKRFKENAKKAKGLLTKASKLLDRLPPTSRDEVDPPEDVQELLHSVVDPETAKSLIDIFTGINAASQGAFGMFAIEGVFEDAADGVADLVKKGFGGDNIESYHSRLFKRAMDASDPDQ